MAFSKNGPDLETLVLFNIATNKGQIYANDLMPYTKGNSFKLTCMSQL